MEFPLVLTGMNLLPLVLSRVGGFFVSVPLLGSESIPGRIRLALVFLLGLILLPLAAAKGVLPPPGPIPYALAVVRESFVGVILGFSVTLAIEGARLAGEMFGTQVGFGMIGVLDPDTQVEESLTEVFHFFLFLLVFLMIDGHHAFLEALAGSFDSLPTGALGFGPEVFARIASEAATLFTLSIKVAAPTIVPMVVVTVVLGIVSKMVPRMEVFLLGFPIKILLGFGMMIVILPWLVRVLESVTRGAIADLPRLLVFMR